MHLHHPGAWFASTWRSFILKQSFPGCDAKSTSLRVRAFWLAIVDIVDVNPIFETFPQFLLKADSAFMTFFVSVAHVPSILWCSGKSASGATPRCAE
jgi:hypothetical protein